MSHQLVSYGKPNFNYDAEIFDVINPSLKDNYSRLNPSFENPSIIIKNIFKYDLKSLDIYYGIKDKQKTVYKWVGILKFLKQEIVTLTQPSLISARKVFIFEVEIKKPDEMSDENQITNILISEFELLLGLPKTFLSN